MSGPLGVLGLAIVKVGEKVGVKAVLAKYRINEQSYRNWRYRINGIKPKKTALSNGEA